MGGRRGPSLFTLIYLAIGVFVAADNTYLKNVDDVEAVLSAILAIILWPLVLFDVNLRIK
jgi:hypothetical protein